MEQVSKLDAETGLYTQKMMEILLAHEVARTRRYPNPLSVIYMALRFQQTPANEILESAHMQMASVLQSKLREVDMPGLYEGNYLVILPATDAYGANVAARRMISQFEGKQLTRKAVQYEMSICVGLSSHPGGESASAAELLSQSASALWEAQKRGPRTVVDFEDIRPKES